MRSESTRKRVTATERQARFARDKAASCHFGTVGATATITATFDKRTELVHRSTYLVDMTEQRTGAKLKTFTTGAWIWDLEEGRTFTATAAIDKHGRFRGERYTVISNVRIKKGE
ncbi:hypothetical protein HS041_26860 [Planomonospora sp. ID67723]|uniref:hypothetical protein n=1 Tax=Planomonospora sp. ID67723 TaxID=2738134 RepID=UPI0018C429DA|nr:hypothetical protein [Planomonospora sp. ID67723]MBG0831371.1 hypothetical protein [Planomonospora sp. ID67723]